MLSSSEKVTAESHDPIVRDAPFVIDFDSSLVRTPSFLIASARIDDVSSIDVPSTPDHRASVRPLLLESGDCFGGP